MNVTCTPLVVEHADPSQKDEAVCWLLDVRKFGIERANELHPES